MMGKLSKRRTRMLILATLFLGLCAFALAATNIAAADESGTFAGGSGTEDDPYIIETAAQLDAVRDNPSASYRLNANIVFTEADFAEGGAFYNDSKGWEPIDNFRGTFDGDGHAIRNIVVNSSSYAGIFGSCYSGSKISNLGIENGEINGVGYKEEGGIAGYAYDATFENCYYAGTVSGSGAGGILGESRGNITIKNCYSIGTVNPKGYSGAGIVCYSYGRCTIENCYSIAIIVNSNASSGEIVGEYEEGTITNCYYIEDKLPGVGSGTDTATPCSPEDFAIQATFAGFDFENIWAMGTGDYEFPVLRGLPNNVKYGRTENFTDFAGGYGTKSSPYIIASAKQLSNVRNYPDASFKLANDIQFDPSDFEEGGAFYNEGKGWEPIDNFRGTFDGDGHVIRNLQSKSDESYSEVGLFGYSSGTIKRLGMVNCSFEGEHAGSVCCSNYGKISECYNTGTVRAYYAGGIAYYNAGTIQNCYSSGEIERRKEEYSTFKGGIVGNNDKGKIVSCYNVGLVQNANRRGGIAGTSSENAAVENCYYLNYGYKACGNLDDETGALSLDQMKEKASYAGFDFESTWTINEGSVYQLPVLRIVTNYARTPVENTIDFAGGYGTYDSPYLITGKTQLDNVRKYLYACYRLENDIVFESSDFSKIGDFYNGGKRWEPIGTSENPFYGNFDGNGHCIRGLRVERPDDYYCGLFSYNYGTIGNLKIGNFVINSKDYSAGIVAKNYGTIARCSNDGSFTGFGGVICGENRKTITECFNLADISSEGSIAAITYYNYGTINKCYNAGGIATTGTCAAGIAVNNSYNGMIKDCYNTGDIEADNYAGGIAEYNAGAITGCYNIGAVKIREHSYSSSGEETLRTGGIIAEGNSGGKITNCYYLDASTDYDEDAKYGTKCTVSQIKNKSTYKGFDFAVVWEFDEDSNYGLPTLRGIENYASAPAENKTDFAGGYGTKSSPYIIENKTQLNNVRKKLNACYKMSKDISFSSADFTSGGAFYNDGKGWEPIGDETNMFTGTFDGGGHSITGLKIQRNDQANVGLFGVSAGTIKSVNMVGSSIRGKTKVGSIAGNNSTGSITKCSAKGTITAYAGSSDYSGDYAYAGGIAGYSTGVITYCTNEAAVRSGHCSDYAYAGGIAGHSGYLTENCSNFGKISDLSSSEDYREARLGGIAGTEGGTINKCYNTGQVQGIYAEVTKVGGIVGYNGYETVKNSYNLGNITGKNAVGGIAGFAYGQTDSCYNAGRIEGLSYKEYDSYSEASVGGIVGYSCGHNSPVNCYNIGEVTAKNGNVGGIAGEASNPITTCYNIGNVTCTYGAAGGIAGYSYQSVSDCYYIDNIDKGIGSGYGTATKYSADEMKVKSNYSDKFDFDDDMIWEISGAAEYRFPVLTEVVNPELQYTLSTGTKEGMPQAPVAASYGNGKITIAAVSGQKYVCVPNTDAGYSGEIPAFDDSEWKSASGTVLVFSGLELGKTYKIYTYIPASGSKSASYVSQPLLITLKAAGDLTGDGKIDSSDALYLRRAIAGWEGYELNFSAADINADGKLDMDDIMYLERHIAGWAGYKTLPVAA